MDKVTTSNTKIELESINEEKRIIKGIASSSNSDLMFDAMKIENAEFDLPFPLLHQHEKTKPVGHVTNLKIIKDKIYVEMKMVKPTDDMPDTLKNRLNEAWHEVKTGLVNGLSIGFIPRDYSFNSKGGRDFKKFIIYELSLVTIPANSEARILEYKNLEQKDEIVALDEDKIIDGSVIPKNNGEIKMNFNEHLKDLEASLKQAKEDRNSIQMKSLEAGGTKSLEDKKSFDSLNEKIKAFETEIKDLKIVMQEDIESAKEVTEKMNNEQKSFSGVSIQRAPEKLEKGIAFARFAGVTALAKNNPSVALDIAKSKFGNDKRLHGILKDAVSVGSTADANWAGKLSDYQEISTDFIEFLRPKTLVGKFGTEGIPSLRPIPFNVKVKGQNVGSTAGWTGEGQHKPVTQGQYFDTYMDFSKLTAISVASDELLRFSSPSAAELIRNDLADAIIQKIDEDFIKINNSGITNIKPASITYNFDEKEAGSETAQLPASVAGAAEVQIQALWTTADTNNFNPASAVYITTPAIARKLAVMTTAAGFQRFPKITPLGGDIGGIPLIVSNHVDTGAFILAFASEIWLADDGLVTIDSSNEATIIMDTNPQGIVDGDATAKTHQSYLNMYQSNSVAFRAERYINWKKRRANAVNVADASSWT